MSPENDVGEFIRKYRKPYDPEIDDYDVPPFRKSFERASKSSKIYNMHMYWTKQDPYVVREFIEHYTEPGDIVLDAMCGTGMTGMATMLCREKRPDGSMGRDGSAPRHAILFDISPACIHIARNYTTPIDPRELEQAYRKLLAKVEPEIRPLYKTRCHNCDNDDAQIANTVLSDVYACPRCGADVLFAGGGRWEAMKRGEKVKTLRCDQCGKEFRKAKAEFVRVEPIEIRVDCPVCKTKGEAKARPLEEDDWRRYVDIEGGIRFSDQLGNQVLEEMKRERGLQEIPTKEPPYWYPRDVKFFGDEPKRNCKRGITHPYQMFSRRNLVALATSWHFIQSVANVRIKQELEFAFTGILFSCSYQYRWAPGYEGGGPRMGTYYIPSIIREMHVGETFARKTRSLSAGIRLLSANKGRDQTSLSQVASAAELPFLPDASVDYAFYDPPYGKNINYSELNLMWEAWLGDLTQTEGEILENEYQHKGREDYERMMTEVLREAFRVLKPGRWLTMVYSYADPSMYRTVQTMAHSAGLVDEGEVLHVNSVSKTKAQLDSDKTQQRFLVINFLKPKKDQERRLPRTEDIEYKVILAVQEFLQGTGGQPRDVIYDQVIKRLFTTVQIEQFDLDEIIRNFFRKVGDRWYAPGMLLRRRLKTDRNGQIKMELERVEYPEEETVIRLQEFLAKHGTVPLAELREYYLREIPWLDSLPEEFFDETVEARFVQEKGRVRLPTLDEQRRMQDVQARYLTRQIHRYLDGSVERPSDEELCEWIEFCYESKLYSEGRRLFREVDAGSVSEDLYIRAKKQAEACRIHMVE